MDEYIKRGNAIQIAHTMYKISEGDVEIYHDLMVDNLKILPTITYCQECIYGQELNDKFQRLCEKTDRVVLDKGYCDEAERR